MSDEKIEAAEPAMKDLCEMHEVDYNDLMLKISMALQEMDYSDAPKVQFSRGELHVIYISLEIAGGL